MSLAGLDRRLRALAKVPEDASRTAARRVVVAAKIEGQRIGPLHIGRRKRAVRLSAVARFKGRGAHVQVTVWGRPTAPWTWMTDGTEPHVIAPRGRRGKKRSALKAAGYAHPIARPIVHPGMHGQGAWLHVRRHARRQVPLAYAEAVRKAVS